ncbi:ParB N-terminal domain-containing protein [Achromobacter spanius]|uniref:ParB/Sulfiredoxin domain-containing protein n=1 Tax=Achromobacter spanius TaxID=217203 RepID=A0AA42S870_9BURK|nr:ParB N-terminal domain-containing protein [Achromobacter spanius]MDH0740198.1 hypothetical protein [Achromobacter spanius]
MAYVQHPLSAAFPAMSATEFLSLKDSIENIGVQNPIILYEGMVIDGWHRYSACVELGMSCPESQLSDVDPVDFVRAQNKERRHLSVGAWALIEAELWDWRAAGRPAVDKGAPGAPFPPTVAKMAEAAGASVRTMKQAGKVKREAAPEIKEAVKSGAVSLKDAHAISDLPKEEQAALAAAGPHAIKKAARAVTPSNEASAAQSQPGAKLAPPADAGNDDASNEGLAADALEDYQRLLEDNQMMGRVFDADDRLRAAMAEIARLAEENRVLLTRVNGLVNEKDAAVKAARAYKRKLDALEKRTGTA